jgi:hypothetical protein
LPNDFYPIPRSLSDTDWRHSRPPFVDAGTGISELLGLSRYDGERDQLAYAALSRAPPTARSAPEGDGEVRNVDEQHADVDEEHGHGKLGRSAAACRSPAVALDLELDTRITSEDRHVDRSRGRAPASGLGQYVVACNGTVILRAKDDIKYVAEVVRVARPSATSVLRSMAIVLVTLA